MIQEMIQSRIFALTVTVIILGIASSSSVEAAGKKKNHLSAKAGKKALYLPHVEKVKIEMPDGYFKDFGEDFEARLTTFLTNDGRFIVVKPEDLEGYRSAGFKYRIDSPGLKNSENQDEWWVSGVLPVATVRVKVEAMSFQTGAHGGRMFYGFNERFRNPFNDGKSNLRNEFPLGELPQGQNWFEHSFDRKGKEPFDSQSGLDLGDGFNINATFAWLNVKYAQYRSQLHLRVEFDSPLLGRNEYRLVHVSGHGYFYDLAGAYGQWAGGIKIARAKAMHEAFERAMDATLGTIRESFGELPLTATLDFIGKNGVLHLGTGKNAEVQSGVLYEVLDRPGSVVQVTQSVVSGALAKIIQGELSSLRPGMQLVQVNSLPQSSNFVRRLALQDELTRPIDSTQPVYVGLNQINLNKINLKKAPLGPHGPKDSHLEAYFMSIIESIFLPYRIWRYYQYDQAYHKEADRSEDQPETEWAELDPKAVSSDWSRQVGILRGHEIENQSSAPVVAVVDGGMDYNHPVLHDSLWINSDPVTDSSGLQDRYGWDFISGDSRPFDDGYHGTQVASAIRALHPGVKIMPLKIFNPWGVSHSAAIFGAFQYAVDHGASVIVCGWSTRRRSQALEKGIEYARDHGVLVIAAAGDIGQDMRWMPSYPAVLSKVYPNVITVTSVDEKDKIIPEANSDPTAVNIAVSAKEVLVAEPRHGFSRTSSTGAAAGIVAGVMADHWDRQGPGGKSWQEILAEHSRVVPALSKYVIGGLKLHLR